MWSSTGTTSAPTSPAQRLSATRWESTIQGWTTWPSEAAARAKATWSRATTALASTSTTSPPHTTILGNLIGTDVTGTLPLGNIIGIATSNDSGGLPDRRNGAGGSQRHRLQQGIPRHRAPRRRPGVQLEQTDSDPRQLDPRQRGPRSLHERRAHGERSARRRHRVQRSAELPDRPFGRVREFHDSGPRQVQQRRLDDVHARLLREPSLPEVPARVPRRRDLSGRLGDHDRRGRARRRRRHAPRGRGERGTHLRHGDGPRRKHLRVLAADHLRNDAVVGPRGRRPASADLRHGLRRAGRADHRRHRGGLHVPERPPAVLAFAAASGRHGQRRRRDDAGRDDGNPREGMGLGFSRRPGESPVPHLRHHS